MDTLIQVENYFVHTMITLAYPGRALEENVKLLYAKAANLGLGGSTKHLSRRASIEVYL